jgi:UDP-N-acetyl-D-glucosamine dehydrogenase
LSWKTKQAGMEARFIDLAGYINGQMPHFVVDKVQNALNDHSKPLKGSHIHIVGMAYKRDIDDVRESPALDILHLLKQRGACMTYSDPFVARIHIDGIDMQASDAHEMAAKADCVVIATDHSHFDYAALLEKSHLIVDTRNALKKFSSHKIVRL